MKPVDLSELRGNFYNFFYTQQRLLNWLPLANKKIMEQHVGGASVFTAGAV